MTQLSHDDRRRYADLIVHSLPAQQSFVPETEDSSSVQVERGTSYADCLRDPPALAGPPPIARLANVATDLSDPLRQAVVDRAGHRRTVYRPLLAYAWLQTYRLAQHVLPSAEAARWEHGLQTWCAALSARLEHPDVPALTAPIPAEQGAAAAEAAWCALTLGVAGRTFGRAAWTDKAAAFFASLAQHQSARGAFLRAGASDNPETLWFHELVLLHAASSYAAHVGDPAVAAAVARAADYHQNETQPDHATSQPWGLHAFILNPRTHPLADQMLHTAVMAGPAGADGVSTILLADALHCLRLNL